MTFNEIEKTRESNAKTIIDFDPAMAKLVDRIVFGMSEEDIRLKYAYFDYFGIG